MIDRTDPTRREYRRLAEGEREAVARVKGAGADLIRAIESLGSSREISIAKTNAEQAVMWAVKHITA